MRISTGMIYDANVALLNQQETSLLHTQQQLSTGMRILTPSDDPVGAAQALQVSQDIGVNNQYASNISAVSDTQNHAESALAGVTTLLQNLQTQIVQAGNGALSNSDRGSLAASIKSELDQLISLGNTTDAVGNYLFSGFKGNTQPFVNTATGVQYNGDDGKRMVQVSSNLQLEASASGADIFMRIKNGNGTFVTSAGSTNAGTGVISVGTVSNPTLANGKSYQIQFTSPTTYNVVDTSAGPPGPYPAAVDTSVTPNVTLTGMTYTSGQSITFNGMQFSITGAPATNDTFTIAPSTNVSMFQSITNVVNALNTGVSANNPVSQTQYNAAMNTGLNELSNGLNSVLTARASLGGRMNEATAQQNVGNSLNLQYQQALSNLQSVDYNKAISDLTRQQTLLTASQKSFVQVQNLSMFNYLP